MANGSSSQSGQSEGSFPQSVRARLLRGGGLFRALVVYGRGALVVYGRGARARGQAGGCGWARARVHASRPLSSLPAVEPARCRACLNALVGELFGKVLAIPSGIWFTRDMHNQTNSDIDITLSGRFEVLRHVRGDRGTLRDFTPEAWGVVSGRGVLFTLLPGFEVRPLSDDCVIS